MQRKRQGAQHCFAHKRILSSLLRPGSYATPICDFWSLHWQRSAPNLRDSYEKRQGLLIQRHNPGHCRNPIQFTELFFFFLVQKHKNGCCADNRPHREGLEAALQQTRLLYECWAFGLKELPRKGKKNKTPALDKTGIFSISTPSRIYQFRDDKSNLTVLRQTWCLGMR